MIKQESRCVKWCEEMLDAPDSFNFTFTADEISYDGAMFSYKGDFLDYLGLEDMGVFTSHGEENGSAKKLEELENFGKTLC